MLDTLALKSPPLPEGAAQAVEHHLKTRLCLVNSTGEAEYEFVSGSLPGSFSSSVSVNVCREEFVALPRRGKSGHDVVKRACEPFLRIEGSVHKAMLGHNVYGGPLEPARAAAWFLTDVSRRLELVFPPAADWRYDRVDWAEVFHLGSFESCQAFIQAMSLARYPRRKVNRYAAETVMFAGGTTAFKVYHKGPEFSKNSFRRLACSSEFAVSSVEKLQGKANNLLRFECSIKAKKLIADFGQRPLIRDVTRSYLESVFDRENLRVLREGQAEMDTVRKRYDVHERLHALHTAPLAASLFVTWFNLGALGEAATRDQMARPTFYRHRKLLQEAGVSWTGTDAVFRETLIPADFSPVRSNFRRLTDEAPEVTRALASVAV